MKIIIIYGPPAAGKYTVANEIANRTNFKVFHNHLSIDCVVPVFDFGTPPFGRLIELIRCSTIAEAAREGVDLIHTFVYAHGPDDDHFRRLIAAAEDNGGEACLVLLRCELDEGRRRVISEVRARMGKVKTPEMLKSLHDKWTMNEPLPGRESLIVDNTLLTPADAAERIICHFGLQQQAENGLNRR